MREETVRHLLGLAVRIDDHFVGEPVEDELEVRLDASLLPAPVRGGSGRRNGDGTYRFVDVADGPHPIAVRSPDERWMMLDPAPHVVLPLAQPAAAVVIEAWPTALRSTPLGMTSIRGKLLGSPGVTIAQRIEVDVNGHDSGHRTQSSSLGEFLFLLPGRLDLDADSLVPLALRVAGHAVGGGEIVEGAQRTSFTGPNFRLVPGRETRIRFHVT